MAKKMHLGPIKLVFILRESMSLYTIMSASGRNRFCKTLGLENKQKVIHILYKSGVLGKLDVSNGSGIVEYW